MVPNQFGPRISGSPQPVPLDKRNILGTICLGGPNWLGTICLGGPNFWGPFVHGDRKWGTGSPGIKWVGDQMSCSRNIDLSEKMRMAKKSEGNYSSYSLNEEIYFRTEKRFSIVFSLTFFFRYPPVSLVFFWYLWYFEKCF